jgi:hypothetical protein
MSGRYCVASGGTHVRTPTSSDECWDLTTAGSHVLKVLENTADALTLIKNDDGRDYTEPGSRDQKRALADDTAFDNAWLKVVRNGFADGGACADAPVPTVELGTVPADPINDPLPAGYDFIIVRGPPFFDGKKMTLPHDVFRMEAAVEVLRTFGIGGDYVDFNLALTGIPNCDYIPFYGTRALNAGAPRR